MTKPTPGRHSDRTAWVIFGSTGAADGPGHFHARLLLRDQRFLTVCGQRVRTASGSAPGLAGRFGRISLDFLRSGRTRPEVALDDQLPGFTVTLDDAPAPEELVALGDSVGLALFAVLESLRPDERLAFVLHDVFAVPHGEIGTILGKSTDATKMLTSRARRKVRKVRDLQQSAGTGRQQREVVRAFLAAARDGQFEQLLQVLHPEVKFTVHTSAGRFVTLGATEVASRARVAGGTARGHAATVNGRPGVIAWSEDGTPLSVLAFIVADGRITEITAVIDPAHLTLMNLPDPV
ncbi:sigma factor-like helix-turn-helix DNA-binding protein [Streptomyces sp. NPDC056255]|uniref:sigma factor-like helix-turn-helix DNA-binding protein n=1 Tax=Streptomyces sp. NPDC056255 TaxID=3345764 RepID=UPI0035D52F0A